MNFFEIAIGTAINAGPGVYLSKIKIGVSNLTDLQREEFALLLMSDPYIWDMALKHYDDAQWPDDFADKADALIKSKFADACLSDLGLIVSRLRSHAAKAIAA